MAAWQPRPEDADLSWLGAVGVGSPLPILVGRIESVEDLWESRKQLMQREREQRPHEGCPEEGG